MSVLTIPFKIRTLLKALLLLLVSTALLYVAFRGIRIQRVMDGMVQANLWWILLSIFISLLAFLCRALRWNLLIEALGYAPSVRNTSYAVAIGYLSNLAAPRLGEFTRCGSLGRTDNVPLNSLLGTVIIERVVDALSLGVCILLAGVLEYRRLHHFFIENLARPLEVQWFHFIHSPLAVVAMLLALLSLLFVIRLHKINKPGNSRKIADLLRGLIEGLKTITRLERPLLFVFYSVLIWVLYFLSMYVCLFALPVTDQLGYSAALFLLVAGGLGMSAPVQGGIGAYHILVSQGLVLYGIPRLNGLTFATLVHFSQLVFTVVCGVLALFLVAIKGGQKGQRSQKSQMKSKESKKSRAFGR